MAHLGKATQPSLLLAVATAVALIALSAQPAPLRAQSGARARRPASVAAAQDNTWTALQLPPTSREYHTAVWDPVNSQMLVFSGNWQFGSDQWAYRPSTNIWVPLVPTGGSPPARYGHTAVWDATNSQMLVFGGYYSSYLNDLWAYRPASNAWVQLAPTGSPPSPRAAHTAVWDASNNQMLVFGGNDNNIYFNDLWAYQPGSNSWTQLTPLGSPPSARIGHAAVWDSASTRMLVFGGSGFVNSLNTYFNDLWAYQVSTNTWIQLTPTGSLPPVREGHTAVWDAANSQLLVFGGHNIPPCCSPENFFNDLWAYQSASNAWAQFTPTGGPPTTRAHHTAVWDGSSSRMFVFGGSHNGDRFNDLWIFQLTTTSWSAAQLLPPPRESHSAVWDPTNSQMLVFGGQAQNGPPTSILWAYRPATNTWSQLTPSGTLPPARSWHAAAWDAASSRMLVFGGCCDNHLNPLNDLWAYQPVTNTWAQLTPSGTPPSDQYFYSAVWDTANDQMLLYGGGLWAYRPASNAWVNLTPSIGPVFRTDPTVVWDAANNQMLLFGGYVTYTPFYQNDLWAYQPATNRWTQLTPSGPLPPPRYDHTAVWDVANSQMLVFGGLGTTNYNDLWAYRPAYNAWVQLFPASAIPDPRMDHTAAWDTANDQMLVFGGFNGWFNFNDVWAYRPAAVPTPTPTATATATYTPSATATATPTATSTATPSPTGTATPTVTSTATPTATSTAARTTTGTATPTATSTITATGVTTPCAPRPSVSVVSTANGDGRLRVTVSATTNASTPTNVLARLRFTSGTNGLLDVGTQTGRQPPLTVELPPATAQTTFYVERAAAGQATTVNLDVEDTCGRWPTFVGGGPGAF
ncbi:MAG TPA: kelch repeat-containing protein [Chloroflexota bacterium]|jgi:N-acetylneuraminic acid mutarotase